MGKVVPFFLGKIDHWPSRFQWSRIFSVSALVGGIEFSLPKGNKDLTSSALLRFASVKIGFKVHANANVWPIQYCVFSFDVKYFSPKFPNFNPNPTHDPNLDSALIIAWALTLTLALTLILTLTLSLDSRLCNGLQNGYNRLL